MVFTSGANRGQSKRILDFTGITKEITVSAAFETTPSIGDSFVITTQLAAAAAAGGDATVTNQIAMIAALDAIKGTGWIQTNHSLAERPLGIGGGSSHCAWFDEDLKRATNFFKKFPPEFKSLMLKLDSSTLDSNNQHNLSTIIQHMKEMQFILDSIRISQKTSDQLLLGIANENTLEDALHG